MRILIVEDERRLAEALGQIMAEQRYQADVVFDGADGLDYALTGQYDAIVLDVMLPKVGGFEVARRLRCAHVSTPILMLTARDEIPDKIAGLDHGADDYMTKPFQPLELVARVKAQLRRYKQYNAGAEPGGGALVISGLVLDRRAHTCTLNDRPLSLTPTEFSILQILCEHRGEVVSSEDLFHRIWKDEYYTKSNNTITSHIRHLREKMGDSYEDPKYIKTVWGYGYKIEG